MLMSLGEFVFERGTLAPNKISTALNANWQKQNRYGGRPALQFTGITGETVTVPGVLYPNSKITGTDDDLQIIRDMMLAGEDYVLASGDGYINGVFAILSITETRSYLDAEGRPSKIEFEISLERTDNERTTRIENTAS